MSIEIRDKGNRQIIREVDASNNALIEKQKKYYRSDLDAITRDNFNILVGIPVFGYDKSKGVYIEKDTWCVKCGANHRKEKSRLCVACYNIKWGIKFESFNDTWFKKQRTKSFIIKNKIRTYIEQIKDKLKTMKEIPGVTNDTN